MFFIWYIYFKTTQYLKKRRKISKLKKNMEQEQETWKNLFTRILDSTESILIQTTALEKITKH